MIRAINPTALPPIKVSVVTDPRELAELTAVREAYDRNLAWYRERMFDIARANLGKYVCVAGCEVFAADTFAEAMAAAKARHPDDRGILTRFYRPDLRVADR